MGVLCAQFTGRADKGGTEVQEGSIRRDASPADACSGPGSQGSADGAGRSTAATLPTAADSLSHHHLQEEMTESGQKHFVTATATTTTTTPDDGTQTKQSCHSPSYHAREEKECKRDKLK